MVITLWASLARADTFISVAKLTCAGATELFELSQCSMALHESDGRPYLVVDNAPAPGSTRRIAWVETEAWRHDPLFRAMREHRAPVHDGGVDRVHTLLLPLVEPGGLIGSIRCCRTKPFPHDVRRDLAVTSTHVSVRLAQLGITAAAVTAMAQSLSPREQQVAQLAARGLSNSEIGSALAISANTVKKHLAEVFAKIDVSNRTELAFALHPASFLDSAVPFGVTHEDQFAITRGTRRFGHCG